MRAILGPETKIGYAADWSEYFGHQPADGSGDVLFHLDPLWASPAIDFVGIDNYMPLSDWRDGTGHADAAAGSIYDLDYLTGNVAGGEGYDWYYADAAGREAQARLPIADGAYGEDWVFRYKDLVSWWSQPARQPPGRGEGARGDGVAAEVEADLVHRARLPGGEQGHEPAERVPRPEVVGELFPVLFKRVAGRLHPVSLPAGDVRALERPGEQSGVGRLWRADGRHVARPCLGLGRAAVAGLPGAAGDLGRRRNYERGHWLNGRASLAALAEVVAEICGRCGLAAVDVGALHGGVTGYLIEARGDRAAEPAAADAGLWLRQLRGRGRARLRATAAGAVVAELAPDELRRARARSRSCR